VLIPKHDSGSTDKILNRCSRKLNMVTGRRQDARNVTFISAGLQLDLFFAHSEITDLVGSTPTNFGAVFLCRTGSVQHNVQLCSLAHAKGLKFAPYRGLVDRDDKLIASATEEEIYGSLGLPWRHPRERETLELPPWSSVKS
jgi:DNA polymerase/3'-5' exonuclease PolX